MMRKDYTVALNLTGSTVDDPDQMLYENYACGAEGNYNGYCNPAIDKLIDEQSREEDQTKRKQLVWAIERKLAEDYARPIIQYNRGAVCWQPYVKRRDGHGRQHLQRLAHGRRLARQIASSGTRKTHFRLSRRVLSGPIGQARRALSSVDC